MQEKTLLYIHDPATQRMLLAMKKRGFGEGKWNGVGGKVESGETLTQAAVRETHEEIGVLLTEGDLELRARIDFSFEGKPELSQRVHVFFCEVWQGTPEESEEMRPQWFSLDELPYEAMWVSDAFWLPRLIKGEYLHARVHFTERGDSVLGTTIEPLK